MEYLLTYNWNLNDERRYIIDEAQVDLNQLKKGDIVYKDFSNVQFITPYCLLAILSSCRRIRRITGNQVRLSGLQDQVFNYLRRMKFFETGGRYIKLGEDYSNVIPWESSHRSINLIEITKINKSKQQGARDVLEVVSLLRERASEILSIWLQKNLLEIDQFVTVISEIAQNIFEHSGDYGYVALNKYQYSDRTRVNLSIMDGGEGLGNTVKVKLGKRLSKPADYICYPFFHGISRSKGGGLKKVYQLINRWNGSLFVRSGVCYAFKDFGEYEFIAGNDLRRYKGTHIGIWLESEKISPGS